LNKSSTTLATSGVSPGGVGSFNASNSATLAVSSIFSSSDNFSSYGFLVPLLQEFLLFEVK